MAVRTTGSGCTDIGCVRERNEDSYAIGDLDAGTLFDGDGALTATGPRGLCALVCDGMGAAGVPLAEIAYLVGFSEPSAFSRAFRRWFGHAPREHATHIE